MKKFEGVSADLLSF